MEKYLRIFVNHRQTDWSDWLPLAEFTHNNHIHSAMKKSPFLVLYGRNPRIIPNSPQTTPFTNPAAADFAKAMTIIHKEAQKALDEAAGQMKVQYDKGKRTAQNHQIGDRVWLDSTNLSLPRPKKKLNDKR